MHEEPKEPHFFDWFQRLLQPMDLNFWCTDVCFCRLRWNLSAEFIEEKLHEVDSQLCPVATEAPCGTGINERSHRYLQKRIDHLLFQKDYHRERPWITLAWCWNRLEVRPTCERHTPALPQIWNYAAPSRAPRWKYPLYWAHCTHALGVKRNLCTSRSSVSQSSSG